MEPLPLVDARHTGASDMNAGFGSWLLGMSLGAGALAGMLRSPCANLACRRHAEAFVMLAIALLAAAGVYAFGAAAVAFAAPERLDRTSLPGSARDTR